MIKQVFVGKGSMGLYIRLKDVSKDGATYYNTVEECLSEEKAKELSEKLSLKHKVPLLRYDDKVECKPVVVVSDYKRYKTYYMQFIGYDEGVNAWLQWSIYGVNKNNDESELLVYGFYSKEEAKSYIAERQQEFGNYIKLTRVHTTTFKNGNQIIDLTIFNYNDYVYVTTDDKLKVVNMHCIFRGSFSPVEAKIEAKAREFVKGLDIEKIKSKGYDGVEYRYKQFK
jgi:hypothetical protein